MRKIELPEENQPALDAYPKRGVDRDRWIVARRPERNALDPFRPYHFLLEEEPDESNRLLPTAAIFLTNRECPWKCLMCDLWKNTLSESVPTGAIPVQIEYALTRLGPARQIKLYNSGSFFDPNAIPPDDYPAIANRLAGFERVIVECHPSLLGDSAIRFRDLLDGKLEVALGLETAHPGVLEKMNKRLTLDRFRRAAEFLKQQEMDLRVFVLVNPPFLEESEGPEWTRQSVDFAFDCGASVVSLIPTRAGNGAMETLIRSGQFAPPRLRTIEAAAEYGIRLNRGRVFIDLWDLEQFSSCRHCFPSRKARLGKMNLRQRTFDPVACPHCE